MCGLLPPDYHTNQKKSWIFLKLLPKIPLWSFLVKKWSKNFFEQALLKINFSLNLTQFFFINKQR